MTRQLVILFMMILLNPPIAPALELAVESFDGITLVGTLHEPAGVSEFPVVVFTHGSEPGVRNNRGYISWSDAFVNRGVGVLVFDKRGCGDSEGEYVEAPDLNVPATDLTAWVELVAARDEVTSVGVLGWSQGGWVGPLAATQSDHIHFVVSISGPGVSPLEQNIFDKTNQCAATGASPAQVKQFEHTIRLVWTYLVTGKKRQEAAEAWNRVAEEPWFKEAYNGAPMMDRDIVLQDPRMTSYVAHSSYEPGPVLSKVDVPMLAVLGEADRVVPVERSIAAMRKAFDGNRSNLLTIQTIPDADHGLRLPGMGLAKGYPEQVVAWVRDVVKPSSR